MERESFLARVRASLELGEPRTLRPGPHQPPAPPPRDDLVNRLVQELEAVGGFVYRAGSPDEVRGAVVEILGKCGAQRVVLGATEPVRDLELEAVLERAGIEWTVADLDAGGSREQLREANFSADAGITSADFGVAETGTLVLLAARGQGRAVSLLPAVHVAVLRADDVVAELSDLFERVKARGRLPSALTFVTGPSRTGDIELVLTVGVHGPRELHLVVTSSTRGGSRA